MKEKILNYFSDGDKEIYKYYEKQYYRFIFLSLYALITTILIHL